MTHTNICKKSVWSMKGEGQLPALATLRIALMCKLITVFQGKCGQLK